MTEPPADAPAGPPSEPPPPARPPGWRRHLTRVRVAVGLVSGALLTAFALINGAFDLVPGLRPDPPCPSERDATITAPVLDASVTRGEALALQGADTDGVPAERLAQPGKLVSFDLVAVGFRGERVQIKARVRRESGGPVPDLEIRDQLVAELGPDRCRDKDHLEVWSAIPQEPGRYLIEIRVVTPEGDALHAARTPAFDA